VPIVSAHFRSLWNIVDGVIALSAGLFQQTLPRAKELISRSS